MTYRKKLIEVALPLDAINRETIHEKAIKRGKPTQVHLWWARRPLVAARVVIWASLIDDPSAHPEMFPTAEEQDSERQRLFGLLTDLAVWENSDNDELMTAARDEILKFAGEDLPNIVDPFSGGQTIPLEAQRLGLPVFGGDLNPVATLLGKAMLEIPQRFLDSQPVHRVQFGVWNGNGPR